MKGSIRLFSVFGISINIHVTFLLLLALFLSGGIKWLALVTGVFCFVTLHELCHSLVARRFGIGVKEITLLPIGGVASMTSMPEKPSQEFFISIAGPLFNLAVIVIFYFPLKHLLGEAVFFHRPFSTATWPLTAAYLYWINLVLAVFNLIPAFPMDGGRVLRSLLAQRIGYQRATKFAVNLGHIFALIFGYFGITSFNIILIAIAVFIYIAASNEELQVDLKETLKKFRVRDILARDFLTVKSDVPLAKLLEQMLHSHQEDFPVVDGDEMVGFVTRHEIMRGVHTIGTQAEVKDIMRKDAPGVSETDLLTKVQKIMEENNIRALPVLKAGRVAGVVTLEDIGRIYAVASHRT